MVLSSVVDEVDFGNYIPMERVYEYSLLLLGLYYRHHSTTAVFLWKYPRLFTAVVNQPPSFPCPLPCPNLRLEVERKGRGKKEIRSLRYRPSSEPSCIPKSACKRESKESTRIGDTHTKSHGSRDGFVLFELVTLSGRLIMYTLGRLTTYAI